VNRCNSSRKMIPGTKVLAMQTEQSEKHRNMCILVARRGMVARTIDKELHYEKDSREAQNIAREPKSRVAIDALSDFIVSYVFLFSSTHKAFFQVRTMSKS